MLTCFTSIHRNFILMIGFEMPADWIEILHIFDSKAFGLESASRATPHLMNEPRKFSKPVISGDCL